jgi:hypothetical protein
VNQTKVVRVKSFTDQSVKKAYLLEDVWSLSQSTVLTPRVLEYFKAFLMSNTLRIKHIDKVGLSGMFGEPEAIYTNHLWLTKNTEADKVHLCTIWEYKRGQNIYLLEVGLNCIEDLVYIFHDILRGKDRLHSCYQMS